MKTGRLQIALEFIMMLTFITVLFIFFFDIIATQTSLVVNQQAFTQLQLIAQSIAQQINLAVTSGPGYFSNVSVYGTLALPVYSVNITRNGAVIVGAKIGSQVEYAVAYTSARNLLYSGMFSANYITIQNSFGIICIDYTCSNATVTPHSIFSQMTGSGSSYTVNAIVTSAAGKGLPNVLVGLQGAGGTFSTGNSYLTGYTGANGGFGAAYSGTAPTSATSFSQGNGLQANLTGWWPLNLGYGNSAYDLSSYNSVGTLLNASWSQPLYVGNFTSSQSGYLSTGTNGLPSAAAGRTLLAWVYFTGSTAPSNQIYVVESYGTQATDEVAELRIRQGVLEFYDYNSMFTSNLLVTPNTWHQVGYSYSSGASSITLYVDGVSQTGALSDGDSLFTVAAFAGIGAEGGTCQCGFFQGQIANVQQYRVTLTANQIYTLYTEGISAPPLASAFTAYPPYTGWWPLDGSTADYSRRVNTGTSYNGFAFSAPQQLGNSANATSASAAKFNGYDSVVNTTNYGFPNEASSFSQFAWVYPTRYVSTGTTIFNEYNESTVQGEWFGLLNSNPDFEPPAGGDYTSLLAVPLNTLSFVGLVYSAAANTVTFYVNGQSNVVSLPAQTSTLPTLLQIGGDLNYSNYLPGDPWFGSIMNAQVYNTAVPSSSAYQLYKEGPNGLPLTKSLIGWWPLEGSTADLSNLKNSGLAPNALSYNSFSYVQPTVLQYSLGGAGLEFNGAGNVVINSGVQIGSNAVMSAALWVNPSSAISGKENILQMNGAGGGLELNITKGTGYNLQLYMDIGGSWKIVRYQNAFANPSVWYFVGAVYNGSDVNLYINGALVNATAATGSVTTPLTPVSVGGYQSGNFFYGSVANLQLYKAALTPNQMQVLYSSGLLSKSVPFASGTGGSSGPVALGTYAYIASYGSGEINVVQTATNSVVGTISIGSPTGVGLSALTGYGYYTTYGSGGGMLIPTSNSVTGSIGGYSCSGDYGMGESTPGLMAYIPCYGSSTVYVVSMPANAVTSSFSGGISNPFSASFSPNGQYAYVSNWGSNNVVIVNTATNSVVGAVNPGSYSFSDPWGIGFWPSGAYAYISNYGSGSIAIVNTATNTVVGSFAAPSPSGIAVAPNGQYAYVSSWGSSVVDIINVPTNSVVGSVGVGSGSFSYADGVVFSVQ